MIQPIATDVASSTVSLCLSVCLSAWVRHMGELHKNCQTNPDDVWETDPRGPKEPY